MNEFKTGDLVTLKSGGLPMTVGVMDEMFLSQHPDKVRVVYSAPSQSGTLTGPMQLYYECFHRSMLKKME